MRQPVHHFRLALGFVSSRHLTHTASALISSSNLAWSIVSMAGVFLAPTPALAPALAPGWLDAHFLWEGCTSLGRKVIG